MGAIAINYRSPVDDEHDDYDGDDNLDEECTDDDDGDGGDKDLGNCHQSPFVLPQQLFLLRGWSQTHFALNMFLNSG